MKNKMRPGATEICQQGTRQRAQLRREILRKLTPRELEMPVGGEGNIFDCIIWDCYTTR